jgi:hypothetical protein
MRAEFGAGARCGGRRRRRRSGEVHGGTNRALAHVKLPETARRGGVRARDGDGKKIGFDQLEMPPMDMTGGTNALV